MSIFDAIGLAEALFGDHMMANMLVIGAAYQAGVLPMSAQSIESAIELNGVKALDNQHAFRAGRLAVADPDWLASLQIKRAGALDFQAQPSPQISALLAGLPETGELRRLLDVRAPELIAYQNEAYASLYVADVKRVYAREQAFRPGSTDLSEAFARYLFKLMAYKDEYEVARLSLSPAARQALAAQFGAGAKVKYHLQPPMLKALGLRRKIAVGRWFDGVYWMLRKLRFLRGTRLDPFGYDEVRKTERALIQQYRGMVFAAAEALDESSYGRAVELAKLPDMVRGYDEVKLRNVALFQEKARTLG